MLKVASIQLNLSCDTKKNIKKVEQFIKKATKNGAKLIVLQELHNSIYFPYVEDTSYFSLSETIPGASTNRFAKLSKELDIVLVISLFEKRTAGIYHNSAVVLDRGEIAGVYRKMHIPDDPGFYEKFYFTPGDLGFNPIQTSVGKIGVLICWDQWYPEAARIMALNGAEILVYPTAIGWDMSDSDTQREKQLDAWITIQRSHAIANAIPVVVSNRVGYDKGVKNSSNFWGNSFICAEQGEIISALDSKKEGIAYAELDLHNRCDEVRRIWPFFRDRRIDSYEKLNMRFCEDKRWS